MNTWALVPIKNWSDAKSRLAGVLRAEEGQALAEHMTRDVLAALAQARRIDQVALLGTAPQIDRLAADFGCTVLAESGTGDLNRNIDRASAHLAERGADTMLIVPTDLPIIAASDVDALLARHETGITVCVAQRDGGTNALVETPPGRLQHCFGAQSATAHLAAAARAGLPAQSLDIDAFARDIDTPDDLDWLCAQAHEGSAARWLDSSGVRQRLRNDRIEATG